MTLYLSKQQSCFADLDERGECGEVPCSLSWQLQQPSTQRQHRPCQRYYYGSVPGGATLPRKGGRMAPCHLEGMSSRSQSHLAAVRMKGGSCDLWPSECGCSQSWQEPYQVKWCCYQSWGTRLDSLTEGPSWHKCRCCTVTEGSCSVVKLDDLLCWVLF